MKILVNSSLDAGKPEKHEVVEQLREDCHITYNGGIHDEPAHETLTIKSESEATFGQTKDFLGKRDLLGKACQEP